MKTYDEARTGAVLRARQLRRNSTDAEKHLWRAPRSALPQHKWRRQMPIGPYLADFGCFAEKLVIELDGGQHADASDGDAVRTRVMNARGFRVIRFWNNDVLSNTDGVLERIADSLSASPAHSCAVEQPNRHAGGMPACGCSLSRGRGELESAQ